MKRSRISARSIPIILDMDWHIRECNISGPIERFRDAAADPLDGAYFKRELRDLIDRGMLTVIKYGFDDSKKFGSDPARWGDPRLCGTSWSVNPTKRMIKTFWPDRLEHAHD